MNVRRIPAAALIALAVSIAPLVGQEQEKAKPVPKDSVRVRIQGCTKGQIFTAGRRDVDEPGNLEIREGMHLRMNCKKQMMSEIKAHEGSKIEITGLVRKGQYREGINIGGGITVTPGTTAGGASVMRNPTAYQIQIDVEDWHPLEGACRTN